MQENEKELEYKKKIFKRAAGKVVRKLRGDMGIIALYNLSGLPAPSLTRMEKGESDPQFSTICRLAHVHNMKCSDLVRMIEEELPNDFTFKP